MRVKEKTRDLDCYAFEFIQCSSFFLGAPPPPKNEFSKSRG